MSDVWDEPDLPSIREGVKLLVEDEREPERYRRMFRATLAAIDDGRIIVKYAPDSLDAAWAEAWAARPEGWTLAVDAKEGGPARAAAIDDARPLGPDRAVWGNGPTLVAALRALTAKLREVGR